MDTFLFIIISSVIVFNVTKRIALASEKNKPRPNRMTDGEKEAYTLSRQKYWKHLENTKEQHFPHVDHSQDKGTVGVFEVRSDKYKSDKERERLDILGIDEPIHLYKRTDFVFIDRSCHRDDDEDFEEDYGDDSDYDRYDDDDGYGNDDDYEDEDCDDEDDDDCDDEDVEDGREEERSDEEGDISEEDYIQYRRIKAFTTDDFRLGAVDLSYSNAMVLHWDSYVDCYVDGFRYEGDVLIVKLRAFFTDDFEFPK